MHKRAGRVSTVLWLNSISPAAMEAASCSTCHAQCCVSIGACYSMVRACVVRVNTYATTPSHKVSPSSYESSESHGAAFCDAYHMAEVVDGNAALHQRSLPFTARHLGLTRPTAGSLLPKSIGRQSLVPSSPPLHLPNSSSSTFSPAFYHHRYCTSQHTFTSFLGYIR